MASTVSQLGTMLAIYTPYNIRRNLDFYKWRGVLQFVQQQAKQDGLGRLANQANALSVQELNYIFQHDSLNVWSPKGLQQLLLLHIVTTFNLRVEKEVRNVRLGLITIINHNS